MIKYITRVVSSYHLGRLRRQSGLFSAASCNKTGYEKAWIRDNIYESIGLVKLKKYKQLTMSYQAMLECFRKHEAKIDAVIAGGKADKKSCVHPRYHPDTLEEINDEWGNKQNDAVGAFLFMACRLENAGLQIFRDSHDRMIIQKLVKYLSAIEYWQDPDNGIWEEAEEVHASSVGACVAGLIEARAYANVEVELILKGRDALQQLLPRESLNKKADLALLSLIYPYNIVTEEMAEAILVNCERFLVRKNGVIRYEKDQYYSNGSEAEWTMGFPWLALCYRKMGNRKKEREYLKKSMKVLNNRLEMPELYYGKSDVHNENTPLGWAQSLLIAAQT